jgi:phage terminase small subunit
MKKATAPRPRNASSDRAKIKHGQKLEKPPKTRLTKLESGLTEMQEAFCRHFVYDFLTQTEAAVKAGYQDAAVVASRFMNGRDYPKVVERIREMEKDLASQHAVTYESHITQLARIRDLAIAAGSYAPAATAEKQRGMAAGLYITRSEILVGRIDQMSREDVVKEIQKLQAEFPALREAMLPMKEINGVRDRKEDVSILLEGSATRPVDES